MASLSLCIVMVAILLWLSELTIVASSCGRQRLLLLQKGVSPVTKCSKTGNAVKFSAFTRCKDTSCQVQAIAPKLCFACMSQVWDVFKSELCEMTIYGTRISTEQHFGCLGFRAANNEVGQLKSQHCFHNATIYFYYSLQYPLSCLVLTTLVSPAPSSFSICSLSISPIFPLALWYETPT